MPELRCPTCSSPLDPAAFLARVTRYARETDSGGAPCPHCAREIEFRVATNSLLIGYTYWAGSFHFEPIGELRVNGLRLGRTASSVSITLPGGAIRVPGTD